MIWFWPIFPKNVLLGVHLHTAIELLLWLFLPKINLSAWTRETVKRIRCGVNVVACLPAHNKHQQITCAPRRSFFTRAFSVCAKKWNAFLHLMKDSFVWNPFERRQTGQSSMLPRTHSPHAYTRIHRFEYDAYLKKDTKSHMNMRAEPIHNFVVCPKSENGDNQKSKIVIDAATMSNDHICFCTAQRTIMSNANWSP